jgi:hypothetical protein
MRTSEWGVRQLGQAIEDHAANRPIRAVGTTGTPIGLDDGEGEQLVTDSWLRRTFPPPGRPVAPAAPETAHEKYLEALAKMGDAMDAVDRAVRRLVALEGVDGRPLINTEGVDPSHADAWLEDLMKLLQLVPVWKATHVARHGVVGSSSASSWGTDDEEPDPDDAEYDDDDFDREDQQ